MQDLLRDRVVQAVAQADSERDSVAGMFAVGEQATPPAPRLLDLDDVDLIIGRHRRLAQDRGYRLGLEHGRSQGAVETATMLSRRMEVIATQLIGQLNDVIDKTSEELRQDNVKRAVVRRRVEEALVGIVDVRGILAELAGLVSA